MKALFLDIDGVLNSHEFLYVGRTLPTIELDEKLDPVAVARLNQIVERTGCKVVLSSVWRKYHGLSGTRRALVANGYKHALHSKTPCRADGYRGREILDWLSVFPDCTRFAVVDDSDDMDGVRTCLVRTSWQNGLLDEHVERLVELLT